jgi:hypothetical protein
MPFGGGIGRFSRGKPQASSVSGNQQEQEASADSNDAAVELLDATAPSTADPGMWISFDQSVDTDDAFGGDVVATDDFNYSFDDGAPMDTTEEVLEEAEVAAAPPLLNPGSCGNMGLGKFKAMNGGVAQVSGNANSGRISQQDHETTNNLVPSLMPVIRTDNPPLLSQQHQEGAPSNANPQQQPSSFKHQSSPSGFSLFSSSRGPSMTAKTLPNHDSTKDHGATTTSTIRVLASSDGTDCSALPTPPSKAECTIPCILATLGPRNTSPTLQNHGTGSGYHGLLVSSVDDSSRVLPVVLPSTIKPSTSSEQNRAPIHRQQLRTPPGGRNGNNVHVNLGRPSVNQATKVMNTRAGSSMMEQTRPPPNIRTPGITTLPSLKSVPMVTPGPHSPATTILSNEKGLVGPIIASERAQYGRVSTSPANTDNHTSNQDLISFTAGHEINQEEAKVDHSSNNTDDLDFDDLHAKFLGDIRDLEDIQNGNGARLLDMEGLFATAYSASLYDQAQFLDLLNQLEKASVAADEMIMRFQDF